jgi:hypothetical protein
MANLEIVAEDHADHQNQKVFHQGVSKLTRWRTHIISSSSFDELHNYRHSITASPRGAPVVFMQLRSNANNRDSAKNRYRLRLARNSAWTIARQSAAKDFMFERSQPGSWNRPGLMQSTHFPSTLIWKESSFGMPARSGRQPLLIRGFLR